MPSTWTTGRNRLYEEVLTREEKQGWKYKYLIFIDYDVQIGVAGSPIGVSPWRKFENFLLEYEPGFHKKNNKVHLCSRWSPTLWKKTERTDYAIWESNQNRSDVSP